MLFSHNFSVSVYISTVFLVSSSLFSFHYTCCLPRVLTAMGEIRGGLSYVRYENSAPQGLPQLINLLSSPHASGEAGERERDVCRALTLATGDSKSPKLWAKTDRQTDGRTCGQTGRQTKRLTSGLDHGLVVGLKTTTTHERQP